MAFARKKLGIQLTLADDGESAPLDDAGSRTITLEGFRANCIVDMTGQVMAMSRLEMRIYGMTMDTMHSFMTKRLNPIETRRDIITITAGDDQTGMQKIFAGNILTAVPNFDGMPESSFDITGQAGYYHQINPAAANSYKGSVDAASIISALATKMGYSFRNHGVVSKLSNQNLSGTLLDQLSTVVEATNIVCTINNGIIEIFPNDGSVQDGPITISAQTGMVGYPRYAPTGVDVLVQFDPNITVGAEVNLVSQLPDASGQWFVQNLRHELSSVEAGGQFFTRVQLGKAGTYVRRY